MIAFLEGMQERVSAEAQGPTSDRWMDPGGYPLGALNPNEALNCVDDMNRVLLQVHLLPPQSETSMNRG